MRCNYYSHKLLMYLSIFSALFFFWSCATPGKISQVWPGDTWQRSTPEAQGVDSETLMQVFKILKLDRSGINSMVIIRNGYVIAEYYRQPFSKDSVHYLYSCTKSFTSTLMGIAIDRGLVGSVDEPVMQFFPEYTHEDSRVYDITIEDLLTMRSGFEWHNFDTDNIFDPRNDGRIYQKQNNQIEYLFSKRLVQDPGTVFNYNSMNSQLLAEIIHRKTDGNSIGFLEDQLLNPLGISSWYVEKSPTGCFHGGTRMGMTTEDLARLGYLYLNDGEWNGRRIVSKKWISESVSPQTPISSGGRSRDGQYGYQWWVLGEKGYAAMGFGGQRCYVVPGMNTVIAVNSSLIGYQNQILDRVILRDFGLAVVSDKPLPSNRAAVDSLQEYLEEAAEPIPAEIISKTKTLDELLNGKTLHFEENRTGVQAVHFEVNGNNELYADLVYEKTKKSTEDMRLIFSLDGEYRRRTGKTVRDNIAGNTSLDLFSRLTSVRDNAISFEIIISGSLKLWHAVTLTFNGNDIRCDWYTRYYGAQKAELVSFGGTSVE